MANVTKTVSGKWRFIVTVNYKQHSKTFTTKAEGYAWEQKLIDGGSPESNYTFGDLLEKYSREVSEKKKGRRWEQIRIELFKRDKIANIKLVDLSKSDFADWRDRRAEQVADLSVIREMQIFKHCLNVAVNDWELLEKNPMNGVRMPKKPPPRDRLITDDELKEILRQLNYTPTSKLEMITSRVGASVVFAIETAFRAQEICNLKWADVSGRVAKINDSKTYAGVREVPLSRRAMDIIKQCDGIDKNCVFGLKTSQIDSLFRKAKSNAMIEDLHFHDLRHVAITNLASKLDVLELARIVGHKDLKMLLIYYNKKAADLVSKLD